MNNRNILVAIAVIVVLILAVVAFMATRGDDNKTSTTAPASGGTASAGSPAAEGTKGQQQTTAATATTAAGLKDLLKDSSKLTFYVVYTFESAGSNSIKGTYTLAQKPPKSLSSFEIGGQGTFVTINDGQQGYSCTKLGAQPTGVCQKGSATGVGAGLSFFNLAAIAQTASVVPDSKEIDGRKVAGRDARCFQYAPAGSSPSTMCIDKQSGIMVYIETSATEGKMTITATDLKTTVDDKVFDLPYKVQ